MNHWPGARILSDRLRLPPAVQPVVLALGLASAAGFGLVLLRALISGQFKLGFLPGNLFWRGCR
jgi:hypothetical protein